MSKTRILGPDGKPAYLRPRKSPMVLKILSHPLFVTVVSVLLASGLFKQIDDAKEQERLRSELRVQFLEDTGNLFNNTLSTCFTEIRTPDESPTIMTDFIKYREAMYDSRLVVVMKSRALLDDPQFAKDYDEVTFELTYIGDELTNIKHGEATQTSINKISQRIKICENRWHLQTKYVDLPQPYYECYGWAECVWLHCQDLLTARLQKVTKAS